MGADPADSFEAPLQPQQLQSFPVQIDGTLYILLENQELRTLTTAEGENLFKKADMAQDPDTASIILETIQTSQMNEAQLAEYNLLCTQLNEDKSIPHSSDKQIRQAASYYEKNEEYFCPR